MAALSLLSLPNDVLESIIVRVSRSSTKDHIRVKRTCKALRELSELPSVHASIYLFDVNPNKWAYDTFFLKQCYDRGNPFAVYVKGCQDFFRFDKQDDGLAIIRLAADEGCTIALYTYAMLRYVLWNDSTYLRMFTRESIRMISSDFVILLRLAPYRWQLSMLDKVVTGDDVHDIMHTCKCTPYDEQFNWYDEAAKGPDICFRCFWMREVGIFFQFFGFIAFPSTRLW